MPIELELSLGFLAAFNAQTALKLLIIAIASPLWWPVARAMRNEVTETLAPDGGLYGNKPNRAMTPTPPGLDPFLNVPLARFRQHAPQSSGRAASGGSRAQSSPSGRGQAGTVQPHAQSSQARSSRGARGVRGQAGRRVAAAPRRPKF